MNRRRWSTRNRIVRIRRRRLIDFERYNPQIPLPFAPVTSLYSDLRDERDERDERDGFG